MSQERSRSGLPSDTDETVSSSYKRGFRHCEKVGGQLDGKRGRSPIEKTFEMEDYRMNCAEAPCERSNAERTSSRDDRLTATEKGTSREIGKPEGGVMRSSEEKERG